MFLQACNVVAEDHRVHNNPVDLPYYRSIDQRTAETLRSGLHELISQHRTLSKRQLWSVLEKSEAVAGAPDNIQLFYSRRIIAAAQKASGVNQAQPDYWNREHIWPQSYGLKKNSARLDVHNIVAADRTINSSRGNKFFDNGGRAHKECPLCRQDRNSWEPPDETKGDVARIVLYMALRYDGNDTSGAKDLALYGRASRGVKTHFGNLDVLVQWHCNDPVSDYERHRNAVIYQEQGNRNPFIDRPDWVSVLHGQHCSERVVDSGKKSVVKIN